MKFFAVVLGATFAMSAAACGKKEAGGGGGGGGESGGGGGDLPATCQKFLDTYKKCVGEMPEAGRGAMNDALKQMEEGWKKVPKDAMEAGCKQAWDASKGSMGQMCPGVKWE